MFRPSHSAELHRIAAELVIWECDMLAYRGGFLRRGISAPGILGGTGYLYERPDDLMYGSNGSSWSRTSCPRRSTTGTTRGSTTSSRTCTVLSEHPTSTPRTPTGVRRSKLLHPSSPCLWVTTPGRGLRSLRSLAINRTLCTPPMSPLAWSLTNISSKALYYRGDLGGRAENWVDRAALQKTLVPRLFRGRQEPCSWRVPRPPSRTEWPQLDWQEAIVSDEIDFRHGARLTHRESIEVRTLQFDERKAQHPVSFRSTMGII